MVSYIGSWRFWYILWLAKFLGVIMNLRQRVTFSRCLHKCTKAAGNRCMSSAKYATKMECFVRGGMNSLIKRHFYLNFTQKYSFTLRMRHFSDRVLCIITVSWSKCFRQTISLMLLSSFLVFFIFNEFTFLTPNTM